MSEPIRSYRDLIAWQKAFQLGLAAHGLSHRLPEHERFGLVVQIRRSAHSAASQVANGYGRGNTVEYVRILKNARGTIYDLDTQLLFALEPRYVTPDAYEPVKAALDEAERVLAGLIRSLEGGRG